MYFVHVDYDDDDCPKYYTTSATNDLAEAPYDYLFIDMYETRQEKAVTTTLILDEPLFDI